VTVDRRRFLQVAVLGTAPGVLGAGVGTVAVRATADDQAVGTAATSGPGLGVRRTIWSGTSETDVALTFDDGPDPQLTPGLLDVLDRLRVPATFMVIGARAAERPDLVQRARDAGHEIGNHTWSHHSLALLPPDEVRRELARTAEVIGEARFFRPPRGVLTGAGAQAAAELGYDTLMWSGGSGVELRPGMVCCLHDGLGRAGFSRWGPTVRTMRTKRARELAELPGKIERARDAGVRFVTVSELVRESVGLSGDT
jgi:peptidoglycan-N-acetylglucosamine deacetylase